MAKYDQESRALALGEHIPLASRISNPTDVRSAGSQGEAL